MAVEGLEHSVVGQMWAFLSNLFQGLFAKFVVAVIILLVGFILGKMLGRLLKRILHEIEMNKILKNATGVQMGLEEVLSSFLTYFIYFITIITALNQLGLTTPILNMLSAAVIVIVIISIFLAIKDFIPNAFSGFFIYRNKFLNEGDIIKFKGLQGEIIQISLLETQVKTKSGDVIFIPNSALTKTEIVKVRGASEKKKPKKKKTVKKKKK